MPAPKNSGRLWSRQARGHAHLLGRGALVDACLPLSFLAHDTHMTHKTHTTHGMHTTYTTHNTHTTHHALLPLLAQTHNWHSEPELMKKIIEFYTKAKAYKQLGMFYDACSQLEIDEFRDYDKALRSSPIPECPPSSLSPRLPACPPPRLPAYIPPLTSSRLLLAPSARLAGTSVLGCGVCGVGVGMGGEGGRGLCVVCVQARGWCKGCSSPAPATHGRDVPVRSRRAIIRFDSIRFDSIGLVTHERDVAVRSRRARSTWSRQASILPPSSAASNASRSFVSIARVCVCVCVA